MIESPLDRYRFVPNDEGFNGLASLDGNLISTDSHLPTAVHFF